MIIWLSVQLHCLKGEQIQTGSGWLTFHCDWRDYEPTKEHCVGNSPSAAELVRETLVRITSNIPRKHSNVIICYE